MEWVETTGRTVAEAIERALDRLGVAADEAEIQVVNEEKTGLFGRVKSEAHVKARVRPQDARSKQDRRDRRKPRADRPDAGPRQDREHNGNRKSGQQGQRQDRPNRQPAERRQPKETPMSDDRTNGESQVAPAEVAASAEHFLVGLAAALGVEATSRSVVDGDDIDVHLDGDNLGLLVGPKGNTLAAIQDVTRVVSQRRLGDHSTHLRVDVAGYREKRRVALSRFTEQVIADVKSSGSARMLEPMSSADRKVVHDTVMNAGGVSSRSHGDDPNRRVVIEPVANED